MSSDRVLASAPGECCTKTVQHTGTAAGEWAQLGPLNTYVSYPPQKAEKYDRVIFFLADIWGVGYINNQLLMDWFAAQGYLVLGPDFLEGDPVTLHLGQPGWELAPWVTPKREKAYTTLPLWVDALKARYGHENTKYFPVGYCFGGPDVLNFCSTDWIAAGAFAHPAFVNESHTSHPTGPLLMSCGETDHTFPTSSRRKAEDILVGLKAEYHIQVFSGVVHGFAIRGNPDVEHERWAKEKSAEAIIEWFNRFSK